MKAFAFLLLLLCALPALAGKNTVCFVFASKLATFQDLQRAYVKVFDVCESRGISLSELTFDGDAPLLPSASTGERIQIQKGLSVLAEQGAKLADSERLKLKESLIEELEKRNKGVAAAQTKIDRIKVKETQVEASKKIAELNETGADPVERSLHSARTTSFILSSHNGFHFSKDSILVHDFKTNRSETLAWSKPWTDRDLFIDIQYDDEAGIGLLSGATVDKHQVYRSTYYEVVERKGGVMTRKRLVSGMNVTTDESVDTVGLSPDRKSFALVNEGVFEIRSLKTGKLLKSTPVARKKVTYGHFRWFETGEIVLVTEEDVYVYSPNSKDQKSRKIEVKKDVGNSLRDFFYRDGNIYKLTYEPTDTESILVIEKITGRSSKLKIPIGPRGDVELGGFSTDGTFTAAQHIGNNQWVSWMFEFTGKGYRTLARIEEAGKMYIQKLNVADPETGLTLEGGYSYESLDHKVSWRTYSIRQDLLNSE